MLILLLIGFLIFWMITKLNYQLIQYDKCDIAQNAELNRVGEQEGSGRPIERVKKINCQKQVIIIDGSNVAYKHSGNRKEFSVEGLLICIEYFQRRDGFYVIAVIPKFRIRKDKKLLELELQGNVHAVPATSNDDLVMLELAVEHNGFVISNDQYRNFIGVISQEVDFIIKNRRIGFYWNSDKFDLIQRRNGINVLTRNYILYKNQLLMNDEKDNILGRPYVQL